MARLRWSAIAALATALCMLAPGAANAAVVDYDLNDLVARSSSIVEVRVADTESYRDGASDATGQLILTDNQVSVLKVLKGTEPARVVVTQPGGTVGTERLVVTELPRFSPGERCILFLNAGNDVVGGYQGKMQIVDDQVPALGVSLEDAEEQIIALAEKTAPVEPPAEPEPFVLPPGDPEMPAYAIASLASVPEFQMAGEGEVLEIAAATSIYGSGFEDGTTSGWTLGGSPTWAVTTQRRQAGSYALYGSGGGSGAVAAPGPCPTGVNATATRTFSTTGYNTASLEYDYYAALTSSGNNWMGVAFSTTGAGPWYYESTAISTGNSGGWQHKSIDLRQVTDYFGAGTIDLTGRPTVYVRFAFQHGTGAADEGVYLDNVAVNGDNVTLPAVTSVTPQGANAGIGSTVTITGTNFGATQGAGSVRFLHGQYMNGTKVNAPIVSWSDTQIVCQVPRYAQSGAVTVTNASNQTAAGYTYQVGFSTGGLRVTALPFSYRVNENTADLSGEGAAIQAALPTWSSAGSSFRLTYGGTCSTTTNPPSARDSANDVYFASSGFTDSGILAWNLYWYSGTTIVESDIVFNDAHSWADGAVSGKFDVQTVALHELGHTVGLDDQYLNTAKVMGAASTGATKRALTQSEIDGAIHLYGATDTTPPAAPAVTSSSHPSQSQWYSNKTLAFSYSSTDPSGIAGYSWALDQQAATTPDTVSEGTGTTAGFSACPDGTWYFHVRAKDGAGNWGSTAHYAVNVDTVYPVTAADAPSEWVASATVALTPSEAGAATYFRTDGAAWAPYVSPVAVTSEGTHTVAYYSVDRAGNAEVPRDLTVRVDATPPLTTDDAVAEYTASARISLVASDAVSGVDCTEYRLDGGAWTQGTVADVTAAGAHALEYRSTDVAGNVEDVRIAAFNVTTPTTRFEQTDSRIAYGGPWAQSAGASRSAGSWAYVNSPATAVVAFDGTSFQLIGSTAPTYGIARVTLDGGAPVDVDFYSAGYMNRVPVFSASGLASGVHTVTIEWTGRKNAASSNTGIGIDAVDVRGTLAQAALPYETPKRHEQGDTRIAYEGAWSAASNASRSGGDWLCSNTPGSSAYVTFTGSTVTLVGSTAPTYGIARVTIDGGAPVDVDFYSAGYVHQAQVFKTTDLIEGTHVLRLQWTGSRNAASSGTGIGIDAVDVTGGLVQSLLHYEQDSPYLAYEGSWTSASSASRYAGGWYYTNTAGSAAYLKFNGTEVSLYGSTAPTYGQALVSVDGGTPVLVEYYSANYLNKIKVFEAKGLPPGEHTVKIERVGTKNAASTGTGIGLDAVKVAGALKQATAPTVSLTRYEQTAPQINWIGAWSTAASASRSGGSWAYANAEGSSASFAFTGTRFDLLVSTAPTYGIARVTVDGTPYLVDLYSAAYLHQVRAFSSGGLADGPHAVTVEWTGTKNAASSRAGIGIDAIEVAGTLQ